MSEPTRNRETLDSYEAIARDYAASTEGAPTGVGAEALARFASLLPDGGTVLELGSGPGWDADVLEAQGARVRRTDGARSFCDVQAGRGRRCDLLDAGLAPTWRARLDDDEGRWLLVLARRHWGLHDTSASE